MLSGVEDLQIDTLAAGERYRLTLAVRSSEPLPSGGPFLRRRLSTEITLRNQ